MTPTTTPTPTPSLVKTSLENAGKDVMAVSLATCMYTSFPESWKTIFSLLGVYKTSRGLQTMATKPGIFSTVHVLCSTQLHGFCNNLSIVQQVYILKFVQQYLFITLTKTSRSFSNWSGNSAVDWRSCNKIAIVQCNYRDCYRFTKGQWFVNSQ